MNHLTTKQVFQIVDGTIANGERSKLILHLETCQRCRQEIQLHKNLGRVAKETPLVKPSIGFTSGVIGKIAPAKKKTITSVIINNLGNILAMALVLTAVWYAATLSPPAKSSAEPSAIAKALTVYEDYYAKAREVVSKQYGTAVSVPRREPSTKPTEITALTVFSLLLLVGIDRFVVRRMFRIRA